MTLKISVLVKTGIRERQTDRWRDGEMQRHTGEHTLSMPKHMRRGSVSYDARD